MKLLIVDDNEQSLYLLRSALEQSGHEVRSASDGAEALALAGRFAPDAVISDILMPRLDGRVADREVRARVQALETALHSLAQTLSGAAGAGATPATPGE